MRIYSLRLSGKDLKMIRLSGNCVVFQCQCICKSKTMDVIWIPKCGMKFWALDENLFSVNFVDWRWKDFFSLCDFSF